MEQTEQLSEASYRVAMKQTSKGEWYAEFTVRSDTIEELKSKFEEAKEYVKKQLKELNQNETNIN